MAGSPCPRGHPMERRHLQWVIVGLVAAAFLVGIGVVAYQLRDGSPTANAHSIAGLWVSVLGFAVTMYTLYQTQKVSEESQRSIEAAAARAEETVKKANAQVRAAL